MESSTGTNFLGINGHIAIDIIAKTAVGSILTPLDSSFEEKYSFVVITNIDPDDPDYLPGDILVVRTQGIDSFEYRSATHHFVPKNFIIGILYDDDEPQ